MLLSDEGLSDTEASSEPVLLLGCLGTRVLALLSGPSGFGLHGSEGEMALLLLGDI